MKENNPFKSLLRGFRAWCLFMAFKGIQCKQNGEAGRCNIAQDVKSLWSGILLYSGADQKLLEISMWRRGHEVIYVLYCTGYCADNGQKEEMSGFGRQETWNNPSKS